jgi:hypothetical protein
MVGAAVVHGVSLETTSLAPEPCVTLVTKRVVTEGLFNGPKVATLDDALVNAFTSPCPGRANRSVTAPGLY